MGKSDGEKVETSKYDPIPLGPPKSDVVCPHKNKCKSYPRECGSCKHNTGIKDYYEPAIPYPRHHPLVPQLEDLRWR